MSERTWPTSFLFSMVLLVLVAALPSCSGEGSPPGTSKSPTAVAATSDGATVRADGVFTLDALVAAGWKKSKQLDASLLPGATAVWYGFHDQRDIEVRIYPSHADAAGAGVAAALEALGRSPNSNIGGGIITSLGNRTQYHAYVVAGNLVLLCEQSTETCLKLVKLLP